MAVEPKLCSNLVLVADYRMESHTMDHENYINVSRNRKRRAKALLGIRYISIKMYMNFTFTTNFLFTTFDMVTITDFERHDDDELGFRKNDIITVLSQKDEHCWVGELNGLRGVYYILIIFYMHEPYNSFISLSLRMVSC